MSDDDTTKNRRMFLSHEDEITFLRNQIAQEVKEKYAAYRRIAELTGSVENSKEDTK